MDRRTLIIPILFLLLIDFALAVDFTPQGNLNLRGRLNITNASYVCIGSECRSSWIGNSSAGSGNVTSFNNLSDFPRNTSLVNNFLKNFFNNGTATLGNFSSVQIDPGSGMSVTTFSNGSIQINATYDSSASGWVNNTATTSTQLNVSVSNITVMRFMQDIYVQPGNGSDIQAKIDSCPNTACTLVLLNTNGNYTLNQTLQIKSNLTLKGDGVIIFSENASGNMMNHSTAIIENFVISGLKFYGNGKSTGGLDDRGIYIYSGRKILIENSYFTNVNKTFIVIKFATGVSIRNNIFINGGGAGVTFNPVNDSILENNYAENLSEEFFDINFDSHRNTISGNKAYNLQDEAIDFNAESNDNIVIGNEFNSIQRCVFLSSGSSGNKIIGNTFTANAAGQNTSCIILVVSSNKSINDTLISNNIIKGFDMGIDSSPQTGHKFVSLIITGNRISNTTTRGIFVSGGERLVIEGNVVDGAGEDGIYVFSSNFSTITGNIALDNGKYAVTGAGIRIGGTSEQTTISGNIVGNSQPVGTQLYGVRLRDTADYTSLSNNVFQWNNVSAYSDETGSTHNSYLHYNGTCLVNSNDGKCLQAVNYSSSAAGWTNNTFTVVTELNTNITGTLNVTGKITAGGTLDTSGLINSGTDVLATGSDFYDDSGSVFLRGEDSVFIGMDYNSNDALGTNRMFFERDTTLGTACTGQSCLMMLNETGVLSLGSQSKPVNGISAKMQINASNATNGATQAVLYGLHIFNYTGTTLLSVDGAGKTGIGTATPNQLLDVNGSVNMSGNITIGVLGENQTNISTTQTGDYLISAARFIGINTSTPTHALTVDGDVNVTGNIRHHGSLISWSPMVFKTSSAGVETTRMTINDTNGVIEAHYGMRVLPSGNKPTCDATTRGVEWFTPGALGVLDVKELCRKSALDIYAWVPVNT